MRNFPVAEILKTLFLCIASLNLGISSGLIFLGVLFALGFVYLGFRDIRLFLGGSVNVPVYRKSLAYGAIVPFAIWWVLTPNVDFGVSPWIVFIPGFYLLYLAFLQKRSLGKGAYEVFVAFNGMAALLLGFFHAPRFCVALGLTGILLAVTAYGRPRTALWKHLLFLILFFGMGAAAFGGWKYWRTHHHYNAEKAQRYYEKTRVLGFDPAVSLGSFSENIVGYYNDQVVLRVWDSLAPNYLRAVAYETYGGGIWKIPNVPLKDLYPTKYYVDYGVFEREDSLTSDRNSHRVWVQSALDNFGYFFSAPGAVGVAAKNVDTLKLMPGLVFAASGSQSDWFYYMPDSMPVASPENPDSYLQVNGRLENFLDTVSLAMGLDSAQSASQIASVVAQYFRENFQYAMKLPFNGKDFGDPLFGFWKHRSGYCEYFASLSVLLFRHQGIPARYVTGFAAPERKAGRDYVVYRRNRSHSWVEVWTDGEWKLFDPTPRTLVPPSPSFFGDFMESAQAKFARLLHVLKDGEWRLALTSWESLLTGILESMAFYIFLGILIVVVLVLKFRKFLGAVPQESAAAAKLQWIKKLESAEKSLARQGFYRGGGETVASFIRRLESAALAKSSPENAAFKQALQTLKDYEANRWTCGQ